MAGIDTRYLPVFLDLTGRPCVVVGEGAPAEKRVRQLLKYEADVIVFTPMPSPWLVQAEADGRLTIERRSYVRGDLYGTFLAVCVSEDTEVRAGVFAEAEALGCLVNIAGEAAKSSYIFPSITHRAPIQIAVSTAGAAPEIAKLLRKRIESVIGDEWGEWVRLVAAVRARVLSSSQEIQAAEGQAAMTAVTDTAVITRLEAGEQLTADDFFSVSAGESSGDTGAESGSGTDATTPD